MKDILLSISGSQMQGDEDNSIELTTQGQLDFENGVGVLSYNDSEDDAENVETRISVNGDVVTMQKTGSIETHFIFERGKTYITEYLTPFGALDVTLYPTLVDAKIEEEKGRIELEYVLDIAGAQVVNRLNLNYTAENKQMPAN